ncbi:transcription elongation factor GreA [Achromobacter mucicolens]|nr:transcription elongation factor GreA [Achromobacter mucicolens]
MPRNIGVVISRHPGLLHDLQSVLGTEDLYNLLEVIAVDAHNRRVLTEPR